MFKYIKTIKYNPTENQPMKDTRKETGDMRVRESVLAEIEELRLKEFNPPFEIKSITQTLDNNVCVVEILAVIQEDQYLFKGTSRRAQGDPVNLTTGYLIALQRALEKMTRKIEKRAEGLVKHADDMVAYRERQKEVNALKPITNNNKLVRALDNLIHSQGSV